MSFKWRLEMRNIVVQACLLICVVVPTFIVIWVFHKKYEIERDTISCRVHKSCKNIRATTEL
jgi:hypothetical protein